LKSAAKTILEFDKASVESFNLLKKALKPNDGNEPSNRDVFIFAMAYGFQHGAFSDEVKRSGTGVRVQYLKPSDEVLMAAIDIAHSESTEFITDPDHRYDLAERYAQGGILLLVESIQDVTRYGNSLAAELVGLLPADVTVVEQEN